MERSLAKDLPSSAPVRVGQILAGKYRVERVIGRGGMGFVVAARHLHLGERVAVKLLLPGARVRADAFERFLREGRAAARMRSEHVARVHDAGVLETGEPYLVLEYLEGVDLRALLRKRGRLPVDTAVLYALQVCEGLAEAHAAGIVHRDLKPGNLFLTRRADGSDVVKVIDFGISKVMSPPVDGSTDSQLTDHDGALGTPAYMAPEQMRSARGADARADIWSLGAVLHGLLTGAPPFSGETMVAVYDAILKGAPSSRAARGEVPPELDEVVRRCLRIDPAERYEDVGQLAAALAEIAPPAARLHAERAMRIAQGRTSSVDVLEEGPGTADGGSSLTASRGSGADPQQQTSPVGEDTLIEGSLTSDQASTEITREPSWVRTSARPSDATPPVAPTTETSRRWFDRRRTVLFFTFGLTLATGGAAGWYARRGAPAEGVSPSTIAPADHRSAAPATPSREEAPPKPPATTPPAPASSTLAPSSLAASTLASNILAPSVPPTPPRRTAEGWRRASTPRVPATTTPAAIPTVPPASASSRVMGLSDTPD